MWWANFKQDKWIRWGKSSNRWFRVYLQCWFLGVISISPVCSNLCEKEELLNLINWWRSIISSIQIFFGVQVTYVVLESNFQAFIERNTVRAYC
jgi:hypothetical protein